MLIFELCFLFFKKLWPDIGFYEAFNVHAYFDSVFVKLPYISSYYFFTDNDQHLSDRASSISKCDAWYSIGNFHPRKINWLYLIRTCKCQLRTLRLCQRHTSTYHNMVVIIIPLKAIEVIITQTSTFSIEAFRVLWTSNAFNVSNRIFICVCWTF